VPPRFFISYARFDDVKSRLTDVANELRQEVRSAASIQENDLQEIGFLDSTNIQNGEDWEKALGTAVRTIRVLVCFCSPQFLDSPYCAKEFAVFQKRLQKAGNLVDDQVVIIPVIWDVGAPKRELPQALARYYQPKGFPDAYNTAGLMHLNKLRQTYPEAYDQVITKLVSLIGNAQRASKLPAWPDDLKFEDLPNFFHNPAPQPYHLTLTVLHEKKTQWKPDESGPNIGSIFDGVAKQNTASGVYWQEIVPDLKNLRAELDRARNERQASIIVVSREDAGKPPWKQLLEIVDDPARTNCAVLLGWSDENPGAPASPAMIAAEIQKLLPNTSAGTSFHDSFPIDDTEKLSNALIKAATALRLKLMKEDPAEKADSAELRAGAVNQGITPDTQPINTGPGKAS
jgi:hypothetical protein